MEVVPLAEKHAVTEFLTSWELKGHEKGLEPGLKQGLKEGLQQGTERMQNALRMLIEARFGPMPDPDRAALTRLSLEDLEQLNLLAGTAGSYDAVQARLYIANNTEHDQ